MYQATEHQEPYYAGMVHHLVEEHNQKFIGEIDTNISNENNEFLFFEFIKKENCDFHIFVNSLYNYIKNYIDLIKISKKFSVFSYKNYNHDLKNICPIAYFEYFINFYKKNHSEHTEDHNYKFRKIEISEFISVNFTYKISYNEFDITYITNCITAEMDIEYYLALYLMQIGKAFDLNKKYIIINLNFCNAEAKKKWNEYKNIKKIFHNHLIENVMSSFCLTAFQSRLYSTLSNNNESINKYKYEFDYAKKNLPEKTEMVMLKNKVLVWDKNYQTESLNFKLCLIKVPISTVHINDSNISYFLRNHFLINIIIETPLFELEYKFVFYEYKENIDDIKLKNSFECKVYKKTKAYDLDGFVLSEPIYIHHAYFNEAKYAEHKQYYLFNEICKLGLKINKHIQSKFYYL